MEQFTMIFKLLKRLSFFLIFFSAIEAGAADSAYGVWAKSPLGTCYNSLEEYLIETFGEEYKSDENIQVTNAFKATDKYKWVRDITPEVNITRVMFKIESNHRACAILFIPYASTILESTEKSSDLLPIRIITTDSPPPGFPETEVIYRLNMDKQIYLPEQCFKHSLGKKKIKVSCRSLYPEFTKK